MRKKPWVKPFLAHEDHYLLRTSYTGQYHDLHPYQKLILEVGMGMGDFIHQSALQHPENLYIGLEKDETCIAKAIATFNTQPVDNLYVIHDNAQKLDTYFKEGEVDEIYLQFSDPWPKKRHLKRRLTYQTFSRQYQTILKNEGAIIFKTDNRDFYTFSLIRLTNEGFKLREMDLDLHAKPSAEPLTGYEKRFMDLGQPIYYAKFIKAP